jgi:Na+/melibiose symporter-like transporter
MNVFFWEFTSKQQGALRLALLPGFLLGISLTRVAHKRFDKKACAMAGLVFITTALHLPIVLRLLGVLPHGGGGALLLVVTIFLMLGGIAGGIAITTASSMMADVAQELEYRSGRPQQGVLFSAISLSQQIGSAVGHMVAGFGIDLIDFPTKAKDPSAVAPEFVSSLGMIYLTASLVGFLGVYAYKRYDLTHARHLETLETVAARRAAAKPGAIADTTERVPVPGASEQSY